MAQESSFTDRQFLAGYLSERESFPWSHLALSLALLAAAGASVGMLSGIFPIAPLDLPTFWQRNAIADVHRNGLLKGIFAGAGSALLPAFLYLAFRRRNALEPLRKAADLLSPLFIVGLVPIFFSAAAWFNQPLVYLIFLVAVTLIFEGALRRAIIAVPPAFSEALGAALGTQKLVRWLPVTVVWLAAIGYCVYFSYFSILNHHRLGTAAFDLGINVNWMYNAMQGHPFRVPVLFGPDGGNFIGAHAIFAALFLWLPFFALRPDAEMLLIVQACFAGLAAIPLYLFARTQISRWAAVAVVLAYLMFAPLHGPNFYDFHELLALMMFQFGLYYALATRRNWLAVTCVIILYLIREDVAVGLTLLGAVLFLTGVRTQAGALIAVCSVSWFIVEKFVIMPAAGVWWFASIYRDLQPATDPSYGGIVKTILSNPAYFVSTLLKEEKLVYFLHMFAPVALLPARHWLLLLLASPGFFFTLMTTGYGPTIAISFQYTAHWVPYLFGSTVLALRWLGSKPNGRARQAAAVGAVLFATLCHSFMFGAVLQRETFVGGFQHIVFRITPEERARYRDLKEIAALIPQAASVSATEQEVPHIAARLDAYTLRYHHADADYLLVNREHVGDASLMQAAMSRSVYGIFAKKGVFFLFKKGLSTPDTTAALAELGLGHIHPRL